jgi:hypothetical protein
VTVFDDESLGKLGKLLLKTYGQDGWGTADHIPRADQYAPEGSFERSFNPMHFEGPKPDPDGPGLEWMAGIQVFEEWARGLRSTKMLIDWIEDSRNRRGGDESLALVGATFLGLEDPVRTTDAVALLESDGDGMQCQHAIKYWEPRIVKFFANNLTMWGTFEFNRAISNVLQADIPIFHSVSHVEDDDAYKVVLRCRGTTGMWLAFLVRHQEMELLASSFGKEGEIMCLGVKPDQPLPKPLAQMNAAEFAEAFRKEMQHGDA